MPAQTSETLQTFSNPHPERDYTVRMSIPEFTCLCPLTGQPDFATIDIEYVPDERCVELKSLKLYIWSFRDQGAFHEAVTNRILDDLVAATAPRFLRVTARFNVRGGIFTLVRWLPQDSLIYYADRDALRSHPEGWAPRLAQEGGFYVPLDTRSGRPEQPILDALGGLVSVEPLHTRRVGPVYRLAPREPRTRAGALLDAPATRP